MKTNNLQHPSYDFTEREMVICKIGLIQGLKASDYITREQAIEMLKPVCKAHKITLEAGLLLEAELDQMLGDSILT